MSKKVLFICTHNSARSQMAEAFLTALYGNEYQAYSAGTELSELNPYSVRAMKEVGIDISEKESKSMREFLGKEFDYVVTVCDSAQEACPFFPGGGIRMHKGFEDPSQFTGTEEYVMAQMRKLRDEIQEWIKETFRQ